MVHAAPPYGPYATIVPAVKENSSTRYNTEDSSKYKEWITKRQCDKQRAIAVAVALSRDLYSVLKIISATGRAPGMAQERSAQDVRICAYLLMR